MLHRNFPEPLGGSIERLSGYQNPRNQGEGPWGDDVESLIDFWQIFDVLRKWWWLILVLIIALTSITALVLFRMTPVFKATATLEVKQQERQIIDVSGIESVIADDEFLITQVELFRSDSLITDVIENLNLMADEDILPSSDDLNALSRNRRLALTVEEVSERMNVTLVDGSRLITVSFDHEDPARAARIANALTDIFIENSLSRKFESTKEAGQFLNERLAIVKQSLERSERELVEYAADNKLVIINDGQQDATVSLDTDALIISNQELAAAKTERVVAESAYQQMLESGASIDVLENSAISELKAERILLNSKYLEKLKDFKPDYPDMIELKSRMDLFDAQVKTETEALVGAELTEFAQNFNLAKAKEDSLFRRVEQLKRSITYIQEKSVDYNILKRQLETERTQYDGLLQRLREVSVSDEIGANLVQIVDRAASPLEPYKPNKTLSIALALIVSSLIGLGTAFGIEVIDDRVKRPDDVTKKLSSTVMGVIPRFKTSANSVELLQDPKSMTAEAYASVRTNLQFSGADGGPRVIQITSTRPGEGKSVSSLGVAMRYAGVGKSVLLIDADLRLPTFLGGIGDSIGLSGLLTTREKLEDNIQTSDFENLSLLPSGAIVPNPSEILSGERMVELLTVAKASYDYVIVDSPPVLGIADALILGALVDASLLVVEGKGVRTPAIRSTMERLQKSGSKILGVILTKYDVSGQGYFDYYKYSYGAAAGNYGQNNNGKKSKAAKKKRKLEIS